jgi:predicted transcriptional regulator
VETKTTAIRIPDPLKREAKAIALARNTTFSEIVRLAIRAYVDAA